MLEYGVFFVKINQIIDTNVPINFYLSPNPEPRTPRHEKAPPSLNIGFPHPGPLGPGLESQRAYDHRGDDLSHVAG